MGKKTKISVLNLDDIDSDDFPIKNTDIKILLKELPKQQEYIKLERDRYWREQEIAERAFGEVVRKYLIK